MQRHVAPTSRDKSAVSVLFRDVEYDCERFIRATKGEILRRIIIFKICLAICTTSLYNSLERWLNKYDERCNCQRTSSV